MRFLEFENRKTAYCLLVIALVFIILAVPFKDGRSTYAHHELGRDLGVERSIDRGVVIELGPESSLGGFHFGPIYYYLIYPFVKLMDFAPYSLAIASGFFMLLTIIGTFFVTTELFKNEILALFASGLMTVSILTFQLTKYGSNPNLVPFFSLVLFYSLKKLADNNRSYFFASALAVSFAVATQLHAVPLITMPLVLIAAAVATDIKNVPFRNILIFLVINIVIYLPYLRHEIQNGFSNSLALFSLVGGGLSWNIYLGHLVQFLEFFFDPFLSLHPFFSSLDFGGVWLRTLSICLLLVVPGVLYFNLRNRKYLHVGDIVLDASTKRIFLLWFLIPSIVFFLPLGLRADFRYYYFFILFPIVYIFLARGIFSLLKAGLHALVIYIFAAFVILQLCQIYIYIDLVTSLT